MTNDPFTAEPSLETTASRFAVVRAALRASPCYCPPCPLCSVVGHDEIPDIIRQPHTMRGRRGGLWRVVGHKCELMPDGVSEGFETEEEAAAWWRDARRNAPLDATGEARRALGLARLEKEHSEIF